MEISSIIIFLLVSLCFHTVIVVNPFIKLPHLCTTSHMMAQCQGAPFVLLSPHPLTIADIAYS